jgi:hypothetical protein
MWKSRAARRWVGVASFGIGCDTAARASSAHHANGADTEGSFAVIGSLAQAASNRTMPNDGIRLLCMLLSLAFAESLHRKAAGGNANGHPKVAVRATRWCRNYSAAAAAAAA